MNYAPAAPGAHLALFADDTSIYATEKHERHVLCKLQRRFTAVNLWCERWNIAFNEGKIQAAHSSIRLRVPDDVLQLNGRDIPFVNNITYLGVTDRRITWGHRIERTVAKVLSTYVRTYFLFKSGRLSANIKLTLYKLLIKLVMTYACPTWEYRADTHLLKLQRLQNRALRTAGNLDRFTPIRELHVAFKIFSPKREELREAWATVCFFCV
jgi:hypothetical protein